MREKIWTCKIEHKRTAYIAIIYVDDLITLACIVKQRSLVVGNGPNQGMKANRPKSGIVYSERVEKEQPPALVGVGVAYPWWRPEEPPLAILLPAIPAGASCSCGPASTLPLFVSTPSLAQLPDTIDWFLTQNHPFSTHRLVCACVCLCESSFIILRHLTTRWNFTSTSTSVMLTDLQRTRCYSWPPCDCGNFRSARFPFCFRFRDVFLPLMEVVYLVHANLYTLMSVVRWMLQAAKGQ